jgi:hypothetical protein
MSLTTAILNAEVPGRAGGPTLRRFAALAIVLTMLVSSERASERRQVIRAARSAFPAHGVGSMGLSLLMDWCPIRVHSRSS